jgi:hypothetical protein
MIPETERGGPAMENIAVGERFHRKILVSTDPSRCEVTVNQNNQGILERAREVPFLCGHFL